MAKKKRDPLYGWRWDKARRQYLSEHPLCLYCQSMGVVTPATLVDHIKPHNGDLDLFWDQSNWQPLCRTHHDATKRREDHQGIAIGCTIDGVALGASHWSKVI